ncbi:MAG: acyclic terpene utilization AtuA family protein [Minwuia sp.]|uniref:acyclic terpene utilization AtuA family protein n=1 Tax=Minwuia sp. TaxID=2493630 RepID=UPI003A89DF72
MADKIIRIGGASGFWGDSGVAAPQLVRRAEIDYLVFDYLAEITMSIMARMRARDADTGYAVDFVSVAMKQVIREIAEKGIKVVSNAGGVNPQACAVALREVCEAAGVKLKIAWVTGDDLLPQEDDYRKAGTTEMFSGAGFPEKCWSMNAYLGAVPVAKALDEGADVVITGRAVDSAVTLGPLIHEFGWSPDDFDLMSAGSLCGHILECGAQATGGLYTDYHRVPGWDDIGYPIAECSADGSFVVTKPDGTGGLVEAGTVKEQLLYEIGDPTAYILPDVVCDFTQVKVEEVGEHRVKVSGAKGRPATDSYKVSATFQDGFRATALITIGGWDAVQKCEKTADAILKRTRRMLAERNMGDYTEALVEVLGGEAMYGPHSRTRNAREAVMKLAVKHPDPKALSIFVKEIAPAGTSFSQGTTGFGGGRPKAQPVIRLFSFLAKKTEVPVQVHVDDRSFDVEVPAGQPLDASTASRPEPVAAEAPSGETVTVPLLAIAHGRSGDKGAHANIGVIARQPEYLPVLRHALTAEAVGAYMSHVFDDGVKIDRFDLPGIGAMNFMLYEALGGGGVASLRNDPQGKAYAQILMDMPVEVPKAWGVHEDVREAAA